MPQKKKGAKRKVARPVIRLICAECKKGIYSTRKNPKNTPDRLEMKKFCRVCKKHTLFKETK